MGRLIYLITTSLDGYAADKDGSFDWAMPSEEVHLFVNDIARSTRTSLLGRKMYDIMKVWETIPTEGTGGPMDGPSAAMNDYAKIWRDSRKIVYSNTLSELKIANASIEREFNPDVVRELVRNEEHNVDIGGPTLAGAAIAADIVDEYHQIIAPVIVGGGTHWLPKDTHVAMKLVDVRRFNNGFAYLHYKKTTQH